MSEEHAPKEPYAKPEAKLIDAGNELDTIERLASSACSGLTELLSRFTSLSEEIEFLVAEIEGLCTLVDAVKDRLARAQARVEGRDVDG